MDRSPASTLAPVAAADILATVIDFLQSTFPDSANQLEPETSLPDVVLVDSLSYLEVVMFLESAFDLSFESRDLDGQAFETPNAIADLVRRKLHEAGRCQSPAG